MPAPGWMITSQAVPTDFQSTDLEDFYRLVVTNVGAAPSSGPVTVTDTLPTALTPVGISYENDEEGTGATVKCVLATLSCTIESPVQSLESIVVILAVKPTSSEAASVTNVATVSGGGAAGAAETAASANPVNSSSAASFEVKNFAFDLADASGTTATQAGDHPFSVTTNLSFPVTETDGGLEGVPYEPRDVVVELPLGFVGDPAALPECSLVDSEKHVCPADTEIGYIKYSQPGDKQLTDRASVGKSPIYNVVPERGRPAQFSTEVAGIAVSLYGAVVDRDGAYALRVLVPGLLRQGFTVNLLSFFGDPAASNAGGGPLAPFLAYPADCEATPTVVVHADSWQDPASLPVNADGSPDLEAVDFSELQWSMAEASLPTPSGCWLLAPLFTPSLSMGPSAAGEEGSSAPDSPSAYTTQLSVPQSSDPVSTPPLLESSFDETPATPPVKNVTVSLPAGVSVSPSAANGLQACSEAQEQLESNEASECPEASKVGSVEVTTPLLGKHDLEEGSPEYGQVIGPEVIDGALYVAQPSAADLALTGKGAGRFPLMIELNDPERGIDVKLPGEAEASEVTGQLTATFKENPQLPFSELKLHINGGPRAPLTNPQECGPYTTSSWVSSWAKEPGEAETGVASSNGFEVAGCGSSLAFAPGFSAGTASAAAGAASPFALTFSRNDGEQDLGGISVQMPDGLLGKIAGVAKCREAEVQAIEASGTGTCAQGSEIGSAAVSAGPGSDPFSISDGKVFLTGPYSGGPFGLAIVVPAVAGPFDLGEVVVRASIEVNPLTAALTVVSSALPQIRDGVPFRLRSASVDVDRAGFMRNATSCAQQAVSATVAGERALGSSEANKSAAVSSAYAANGCASLPFEPALTAVTSGRTSRKEGASLTVKLAFAAEGEANVRRVHVQLPAKLPARQSTLEHACPEAVFAANPASCPPLSIVGSAKATSPLLNVPLEGPAYYVSHGGAAFPEIVAVLQGEGVTIDLHGENYISPKGIITSTFASVPDAPVSDFELSLPQGSDSVLAAINGSVCEGTLSMPTTIDGQNGAQIEQDTKIQVVGCPAVKNEAKPSVTIVKAKTKGKKLLVTVKTSAKGRLRLSGAGIKTTTKKGLAAGRHKLKLKLKARHARKSRLRANLTVGKQSAGKTRKVTL